MIASTEIHSTAQFVHNGDHILIVTIKDDIELTVDDIIDQRAISKRMVGTEPHCVLAIAGERTQATEEARVYAAGNIPEGRVAEAVIIRSLSVRILGNFFLRFNKPGVPTRLFEDYDEAMSWLRAKLNEARQLNAK